MNLIGDGGILTMHIKIERADTGHIDEYDIVGKIEDDMTEQLTEGEENGDNT
jgi:hypothetical protein